MDLFGGTTAVGQGALFDSGEVTPDTIGVICPGCGSELRMSKAVANVFVKCSECQRRGVQVSRLFN